MSSQRSVCTAWSASHRILATIASLSPLVACGERDPAVLAGPRPSAELPASAQIGATASGPGLHVYARFAGACLLNPHGIASCWGRNSDGQIGDGTTIGRLMPTRVAGNLHFSTLALNQFTTCGLTTAGAAYCWGGDGYRLPGQTDNRLVPERVAGHDQFVLLASTSSDACGVTSAGATRCWPVLWTDVMTPQTLAGAPRFVSLVAGNAHFCGLTAASLAYCWGDNSVGQVGNGTSMNQISTPTAVSGGRRFTSISAGFVHTCALDLGGTAYCWGFNLFGALGDGTDTNRTTPTRVATMLRFASISAGNSDTCALTPEDVAYCWGSGYAGQLGNGTPSQTYAPTVPVTGLRFREIAAGGTSTCGVTRDDLPYCWGWNGDGELGDGTTTQRFTPTLVERAAP
jgi:alpha-tubulin suppressor-like RCC1 family protein